MGTWGKGLFDNDFAADVRADYIDKLKFGRTAEEASEEMIRENSGIIGDEEEEPLFWFALAAVEWEYGRLQENVKERALCFTDHDGGQERWGDLEKEWRQTVLDLKETLLSAQPPVKRVRKIKAYENDWELGSVFAYRFNSPYSQEKGYLGKYFVFRVVSKTIWYPNQIIPVIQLYNWTGDCIPDIEQVRTMSKLPAYYPKYVEKTGRLDYNIKLITESEKEIPKDYLTCIGTIPGDDLVPFQGHFYIPYVDVGWQSSPYNRKIEETVIDLMEVWGEYEG